MNAISTVPTVPLPGRKATIGGIVIFFMAYFIYRVYGDGIDLTMNHWMTIWGCIIIILLVFILYTWVNYKQKQILPVEMQLNGVVTERIESALPDTLEKLMVTIENLKVFVADVDTKADLALARGEKE